MIPMSPSVNLLDAVERRREVSATDDRLAALLAEHAEFGAPDTLGRIAFHGTDHYGDNPFWEAGIPFCDQSRSALAWAEGFDAECQASRQRSAA